MAATEPTAAAVVLSVGGSVLLTGEKDAEYLGELAALLRSVGAERPLAVTVGGGRTARDYIRLGRALGLTEVELDEVGIDVTRLHARLLAGRIGPPTPAHPPTSVREAIAALAGASPVVLGGTEPGHTTDGVAALLAVRLRAARVVNATDVDGIYDRDPRASPGARRLDRLSWADLRSMIHRASSGEAGQSLPFDRLGADLLARARIPLAVVHGRTLPNLGAALRGESFPGTWVEP
ncbi:MAG TPA: UMP kinase [Thermoplasmata archaeon]|nr:UMP kinase [Thermoplasmata archaeon]